MFTADRISFFWRMNGIDLSAPRAVVVRLAVSEQHDDDGAPHVCASTEKTYTVERNKTQPQKQPEDYYVEINHNRRLQTEHRQWHIDHMQDHNGNLPYDGSLFPVFHSRLLGELRRVPGGLRLAREGRVRPAERAPDDRERLHDAALPGQRRRTAGRRSRAT